MGAKNQQQDDKHPYASPTTPGLYVTFRAYIIELVCLNVNKKIGPRFWSDQKYWGPKFRREVKGVDNVLKGEGMDEEAITQTAFVQIVKQHNIKSLSHKSTVNRLIKSITCRKTDLIATRKLLKDKPPTKEIDEKKNSVFVDTGDKNVMARIREIENG